MAKLALKGDKLRGPEVIEVLKMLGGVNSGACTGTWPGKIYALTDSGIIDYIWCHEHYTLDSFGNNYPYKIFTLEAFENNYPYKIGDLVRTEYCEDTHCKHVITGMAWNGSTVVYSIDEKPSILYCAAELKPYVEPEQKPETLKVDIPAGYEFAGIDDNAGQVIFEKIKA